MDKRVNSTIRVRLGSSEFYKVKRALQQELQYPHAFNVWDIMDIKREEHTDFLRVLLERDA